jgi:hypothetical protein
MMGFSALSRTLFFLACRTIAAVPITAAAVPAVPAAVIAASFRGP